MGPVEQALRFTDRQVIDGRTAHGHVAVVIEFPVLIDAGAIPLPFGIMPLISEAHRDTVAGAGP